MCAKLQSPPDLCPFESEKLPFFPRHPVNTEHHKIKLDVLWLEETDEHEHAPEQVELELEQRPVWKAVRLFVHLPAPEGVSWEAFRKCPGAEKKLWADQVRSRLPSKQRQIWEEERIGVWRLYKW